MALTEAEQRYIALFGDPRAARMGPGKQWTGSMRGDDPTYVRERAALDAQYEAAEAESAARQHAIYNDGT